MLLIVTGESTRPATQAPSQGAGQTRPVNSGKLFVFTGNVVRIQRRRKRRKKRGIGVGLGVGGEGDLEAGCLLAAEVKAGKGF